MHIRVSFAFINGIQKPTHDLEINFSGMAVKNYRVVINDALFRLRCRVTNLKSHPLLKYYSEHIQHLLNDINDLIFS